MVAPLFFAAALTAQRVSASLIAPNAGQPHTIVGPLDKRQVLPQVSWGHTVSLDAKVSEWIYMSVIYSPGKPPPNPKGSLFLWPGLFERENYQRTNLIQTVTELHDAGQNWQICGARPGQWYVCPPKEKMLCMGGDVEFSEGVFAHLWLITVQSHYRHTHHVEK